MDVFEVHPIKKRKIELSVPASKSILNRALLLAAFTEGETRLSGCENFGRDTRDLLACLHALGIGTEEGLLVRGRRDFSRRAKLNVGSAGTAARFLPAILARLGGDYEFDASEQMRSRPMELLGVLERAGVRIEYLGEVGRFPFRMHSEGLTDLLTVPTDGSTQYASGLLLAAALGDRPSRLRLTGSRTHGSYIQTTLSVMRAFGAEAVRTGDEIAVSPSRGGIPLYEVPPDVSAACYFYALSLLCGAKVLVRGVHPDCGQGDLRFLSLLRERGVVLKDTPKGILSMPAEGSDGKFEGFDLSVKDFSDQALTLAALAPFASSPSRLSGLSHIRGQECDRVEAIRFDLNALGVPCRAERDCVLIEPREPHGGDIETFRDHRVAMAFTLIGLRRGGVRILGADCCQKTFGNYFDLIADIMQ